MTDLSFAWPEPVRDADIEVPVPDAVPQFLDETQWAQSSDAAPYEEEAVEDVDAHGEWDSDEVLHLHAQLAEAEEAIARLEADRALARKRIEQLEAAEEWSEAVITQQRRRLLLLERQVEDFRLMPPAPGRTTWLDRLLGGVSTPVTVDA